jgi:hypothetical protein
LAWSLEGQCTTANAVSSFSHMTLLLSFWLMLIYHTLISHQYYLDLIPTGKLAQRSHKTWMDWRRRDRPKPRWLPCSLAKWCCLRRRCHGFRRQGSGVDLQDGSRGSLQRVSTNSWNHCHWYLLGCNSKLYWYPHSHYISHFQRGHQQPSWLPWSICEWYHVRGRWSGFHYTCRW